MNIYVMKTTRTKRKGFFINISEENQKTITELKEYYAINIAQSFKIFLEKTLKEMKDNDARRKKRIHENI
jgi:hypothetical protein